MNQMQNMYGQQYNSLSSEPNMQSSFDDFAAAAQDGSMEALNNTTTGATASLGVMGDRSPAQTLDQIIRQNNKELLRRRQTFTQQFPNQNPSAEPGRRSSMLEFNAPNNGDLTDFRFDPASPVGTISNPSANMMRLRDPHNSNNDFKQKRARDEMTIDTGFPAQLANFNANSINPYSASLMSSSAMSMDHQNIGYSPMSMNMNGDYEGINPNIAQLSMSANQTSQNMLSTSPMSAHFPYPQTYQDPGGGGGGGGPHNNRAFMRMSQGGNGPLPPRGPAKSQNQMSQLRRGTNLVSPLTLSTHESSESNQTNVMSQPATTTMQSGSRRASADMPSPYLNQPSHDLIMAGGDQMMPSQQLPPQQQQQLQLNAQQDQSISSSRFPGAYSSTGFDMLGILMRVALRANPKIHIGPVDLSCAFVVCDIQKHDLPIVYCSDMFERLTGYTRHEILHRNCRFLQAPDGKVQSGAKRKYVDDKTIHYLKTKISQRSEAQMSMINYRKGGQPFMNLLTVIPIAWDTDEYRYFVGFQVDLVEQPGSVSAKNPDGTYEINYNRSALPAYRLPAPDTSSALENMGGATISKDDVAQVLSTVGSGETDLTKRIWDKLLLENSDDVVHVLSLKGLFLYLSPACKPLLEYEPTELVGTALSSICHPSDIVPVTRELKDASSGNPTNVVYRIRRKNSGYTWFEAHGSLHTEQGKGRKCIILVGRTRPVFTLNRKDIELSENAGDAEMWSKMSTTGFFLYVSATSRAMLDRLPEDLVGTSMQSLMRQESKKEFGRVLELARVGEKSTFKHDMQNRRGQILQAQTTVYPGDAKKGTKPTFLLAQTRLLKITRSMLLNRATSTRAESVGSVTPRTSAVIAPASTSTPDEPKSTGGAAAAAPPAAAIATTSDLSAFVSESGILTEAGGGGVPLGSQDEALAAEDNIFDELKTTRSTSWQFELRQMERTNRLLAEDLQTLLSRKKRRKKRRGMGNGEKDCANCHTRVTPEWRRGPSGQRDLCNSCGLRWAKQIGRVSPRKSVTSEPNSTSPMFQQDDNNQAQDNNSRPNSKENSADTRSKSKSANATDSNNITSKDNSNSNSNSAGTSNTSSSNNNNNHQKQEGDPMKIPKAEQVDSAGSMPPTIEEGQEPAHKDVLPT